MKYKITIQETVCQDFELEANTKDEAVELAKHKYATGELVLEPGELQDVNFNCNHSDC